MNKLRKISLMMVAMMFATIANAYNFTVGNISGKQGETKTISIGLNNETEDITAFAGEFQVPEGVEIIYSADEEEYAFALSGRKSTTHILGSAKQTSGNIMVTCYSSKNKVFTGTSGELFTGQLKLTGAPGTYTLKLVNAYVTSTAAKDFPCADVTFTVTIEEEAAGGEDGPGSADLIPSTDISKYDNVLYFNDVEQRAGDFNLELNMKNAEENITAFQCDIYLPEGVIWNSTTDKRGKVVYNLPTFNEDRTDNSYHTISPIAKNADGSYRMLVYSMEKEYILETDGAIVTLPLTIPEDMEAGDYNIIMKNIVMTDVNTQQTLVDEVVSKLTIPSFVPGDVNADGMVNVTDVVAAISHILGDEPSVFIFPAADINEDGTINVTDVVGIIDIILSSNANANVSAAKQLRAARKALAKGEGCNLEILPFTLTEGATSASVKLNLNNPNDEFTAFQCDILLPEGVDWAHTVDKRGKVKYDQPVFDSVADRTDASYHSVQAAKNGDVFTVIVYSMEKETILDEEGAVLDLPFVFDADLASGVYDVKIKNMVLTRTDQSQILPADYTFSIVVGSPEENFLKLNGNYTAESITALNAALKNNMKVAAIDLTEAANIDANTAVATGNKNLMLFVDENANVKNVNNVVKGEVCDNLVLTDGYDFSTPKAFTAAVASYERILAAEWGTMMLPYAVSSSSDVQYYALTDVDLENGVLTFEEMANVAANTPAVYKATGSALSANSANVEIPVCVSPAVGDAVAGLTLTGSLAKTTLNDLDPAASTGIYYIKDNKFWRGNGTLTIPAFRAYFDAAVAGAKMMSILGEAATGINAVVNDSESKIYTIDGKPIFGNVKNLPAGMYIINDKKVVIKK